ncbi:MAG: M20/M25/M40 family metallo-hydrolase [Deltaproteobacteria bacterium]|nr:M20/M25/M40 family metallo-hydrolase [Deltaproteobacteria bacterium]
MTIRDQVDWNGAFDEMLGHFKTLLRFETVNPPGNEKPAAQYLADVLKKEGLEPELFDSAENRANLVCRIKGTGREEPLLLNGHLDVVPVEIEHWALPPFGAEEKDGCIYGRGTLDMKNMVAMCLMSMILVKRAGVIPKRDLIFCAVADEETGGQFGSQFMVENHPKKVQAEYALSEIGGFSMEIDKTRFYPVQIAEKGVCWLRIETSGDPGHGSIPDPGSALIKAAGIAEKLGRTFLPQHNTEPAIRFINKVAAHLKFPKNLVFGLLLKPGLSGILLKKAMKDKSAAQTLAAMLHNTANPTIFHSGEKINVIASKAVLEVDCRILPGSTSHDLIREIRAVIGNEPEIKIIKELTPTQAPADDPVMDLIAESITRRDPEGIVVPTLITGLTDASHWKKLGIKCYGFSPVRLPPDISFKNLIHGHNERIPISGLRFGLDALFEVVERLLFD